MFCWCVSNPSSFTDDTGMLYPTPVIMAWGDDAEITYHADRRVKGVVRFFQKTDNELDQQQKLIEGANSSTFLMDYEIPARVTTYKEVSTTSCCTVWCPPQRKARPFSMCAAWCS